jgi:hypothetical protein
VKQVFRRLQADLPKGLARLDSELDRLISGYLSASGVSYRRQPENGHVRFEFAASARLPEGFEKGGTVVAGRGGDAAEFDSLHPGHPLVQAAVEEARAASRQRFRVTWKLDRSAPEELRAFKGRPGRLVLSRVRYDGFERTDRLIPTVLMEGDGSPLGLECGLWLLGQAPRRGVEPAPPPGEGEMEDAIEEMVFRDQAEVSAREQALFDRSIEQIERSVEDQLVLTRRRLSIQQKSLDTAEDRRAAAKGSADREDAERRIQAVQKQIDGLEAEIQRLENRNDADYARWRERAHERRYRLPEAIRILDVEFVLE